jgi:hypothetical protein
MSAVIEIRRSVTGRLVPDVSRYRDDLVFVNRNAFVKP